MFQGEPKTAQKPGQLSASRSKQDGKAKGVGKGCGGLRKNPEFQSLGNVPILPPASTPPMNWDSNNVAKGCVGAMKPAALHIRRKARNGKAQLQSWVGPKWFSDNHQPHYYECKLSSPAPELLVHKLIKVWDSTTYSFNKPPPNLIDRLSFKKTTAFL